jgi:probable aminopeptidase NPEPL1
MHASVVIDFELVSDWHPKSQAPLHLLVLAPAGISRSKDFLRAAPAHVSAAVLRELLQSNRETDRKPDSRFSHRTADGHTIEFATLPDSVSRYNAPSRCEAIRRATLTSAATADFVVIVSEDPAHALPALNAVGRAFPMLNLKSTPRSKRNRRVRALVTDPHGKPIVPSQGVAATVAATRDAARLVDMPPSDLDPEALAREARTSLRDLRGVEIREIKGNALLAKGLRGIHAVGRCATSQPRLLIASMGSTASRGPHIALVGKGLTYDTGGLHIKARGSMETMKGDMGGAAAVLGAFRVIAEQCPTARVTMLLCIAENAIGPNAYKPDDVLELHSGKTVEINNTDAEGRIVLADGVSYARRVLGADIILDAATLTGAQMVATGLNHAAVISNDDALESLFVRCGRSSGDLVHPLPFAPEFYMPEFKSPLADMRNSVKDRNNAQSSCAAIFIHAHLEGTGVRWAHVDLAGPSYRDQRGTGYGVALLAAVVGELLAATAESTPPERSRRKGPAMRRKRA